MCPFLLKGVNVEIRKAQKVHGRAPFIEIFSQWLIKRNIVPSKFTRTQSPLICEVVTNGESLWSSLCKLHLSTLNSKVISKFSYLTFPRYLK